jgi:hypothetical protein
MHMTMIRLHVELLTRMSALVHKQVIEGRGNEMHNVPKAVFRGRKINCKVCLGNGATLGCNVKACRNSYHLPCALSKGCHLAVRTQVIHSISSIYQCMGEWKGVLAAMHFVGLEQASQTTCQDI